MTSFQYEFTCRERNLTHISIFKNSKVENNAIVLKQSLKNLEDRSRLDSEHARMLRTTHHTP